MKINNKTVISKDKLEELKIKLKNLLTERKELSKNLEQARLSDVSEDTDAVNTVVAELQHVEKEIAETEHTIENSEVLKKTPSKNTVQVGSTVKVKADGKTKTYIIVSDVEADPLKNKISDSSPVGEALMKAKKGSKVKVEVGDKVVEYKILDIS